MQGGPDLYSITRDLVLANSKDKYLSNSFLPLLLGNVSDLMMKIDVEKWKEALSILIINNSKASLVLDFAERLENSSMFSAAQACFVYAGSSDKVFKSWIRQFKHTVAEGGSYQNAVFNLFFKSLLYAESLQFFDSELLESIYYEYLTMLFKEGMQKEGLEMMHHLKTPRYNVPLMVLIEKYVKATHGNSRAPWKVLAINPVKVKTAPKMREVYPDNPIKTPVSGKVPGPPDHFRTMPKISTMPEPKKTAFSEPIKNVFPEHPPEIKRTPFENPKDPFHSKASDTQKVPFSNLREPDPVPKNISKAPLEKQAIPPPPPPAKPKDLKKDIIPPQIPSKAEVREIEPPISRPTENIKEVPMERTIERQDFNKLTKPEQVKPKEVPVHIVPKTFPPPKIPTTLPQRPILNTATSSEGVDLSGIPSHFLQIAQKWESAIRDPSISNNARILKDVESKMQEFFNKLRSGELNDTTMNLVIELTEAFASGDFATVGRTHLELTNKTWNENGNWLTAMKRIIQAKQSSRSK